MKAIAAAIAFAALAAAVPQPSSVTSLSPAEASVLLFSALPSSIQAIAATNEAEASTIIAEEFLTGTPSWFTTLPTAVQSYFLSEEVAPTGVTASVPLTTGSSGNTTALTTAKYSNSTTTSTGSTTSTGTSASTSASMASAGSSSSTGGAAAPTAILGAGVAGVLGFVGMLAL